MEYKEVQCRCCGSPMRIRPGATRIQCEYCGTDVGRILRTFKIKKNVEVTDNGKIII